MVLTKLKKCTPILRISTQLQQSKFQKVSKKFSQKEVKKIALANSCKSKVIFFHLKHLKITHSI